MHGQGYDQDMHLKSGSRLQGSTSTEPAQGGQRHQAWLWLAFWLPKEHEA